jgi:hypothetical protein
LDLFVSTEISIEKCVQDSVEIYCSTPKSALRRKNEPPVQQNNNSSDANKNNNKKYSNNNGNNNSSHTRPFELTRNTNNSYNHQDALV